MSAAIELRVRRVEYVPSDFGRGIHTVRVEASDHLGNELTVNWPASKQPAIGSSLYVTALADPDDNPAGKVEARR